MATSQRYYDDLVERFELSNPGSKDVYAKATASMPGGNTRSVLYYHPFPVAIRNASGSRLYDVDGHEYVDLLGEYTAGIYGHSEPRIINAITEAAGRGLNYGGHGENEARLAELIKARFPSIDLLRFTNSGTEATLMALAAARAYNGKDKVLVFAGAYHGGAFSFAGGQSGPVNAPFEYLMAIYNDIDSVNRTLESKAHSDSLAAILVEPMIGSGGAIPANADFLKGLRTLATRFNALLIFDEVMTSRMHHGGGIQSTPPAKYKPDVTTFGKYMGGGLSFGAFGGRRAIMDQFDPRRSGALAHAGTFNNNVLTMAAGRVGLEQVFTPARAMALHHRGEQLRRRLQDIAGDSLMKVTGYGSIMSIHFTATPNHQIMRPSDIGSDHKQLGDILHLFLLQQGYYIARRGFIALSLALADDELDGFCGAIGRFVGTYKRLLELPTDRARL
ncbi:hypothetical protein CAC42_6872 [Sphaceloma murrayae]|uniref:Glutamate-1-semialdehyde 2,1-aminomutase n=1 Tax=Sphaceloma murrayae TaxID=2082308 RepID=A0A2K1QHH7_9PEZI|nr:hypothetical protein CAC42_6872 [Sphaceloma murrayae]